MKSRKNKVKLEQERIHYQLQKTKIALETAYSNFENAIEPDLIDCYIYEVNAIQQRYKFLLRKAKELAGPEDVSISVRTVQH